jgi:hypothetical protein
MRRFSLVLMSVAAAIPMLMCTEASADTLVFGPAIPVTGLAPNPNPSTEDFSWVSSDAHLMYAALGNWPNRTIATRSWDADRWSSPVEIGIGPDAVGAYPSPDGNTIYYTGGFGQVYRSQRTGNVWSAGEVVPNVVPPGSQAVMGCFNGHQLFVGVPTNWPSDWDIAVSEYNAADNTFSPAVTIPELQSPAEDYPEWISPDGNRLIFESSRSGGYGSFDLYSADWDGSHWNISNLGPEINTADKEVNGRVADQAGLFLFERIPLSSGGIVLMQATVAPEPSTLVLLGAGVAGFASYRLQRRGVARRIARLDGLRSPTSPRVDR